MPKSPCEKQFKRLDTMTDDTGIIQHSDETAPNPAYDYSIDDQTRALIALSLFYPSIPQHTKFRELHKIYFNYIIEAYEARDDGFPYNFKDKNGDYMDERYGVMQGPDNLQDCHGRGTWSLVEFMFSLYPEKDREKTKECFFSYLNTAEKLTYPQSLALTSIGLSRYLEKNPKNKKIMGLNRFLSDKLAEKYKEHSDKNWKWFSKEITYCAGRLPHAMLLAGKTLRDKKLIKIGRDCLDFLIKNNYDEDSVYHPIGNRGWFTKDEKKAKFDQQPIEPAAMVEALVEAYEITEDKEEKQKFKSSIFHVFQWYEGRNSKKKNMMAENGAIFDAITPWGLNVNQGAEPLVSYLMAASAVNRIIK